MTFKILVALAVVLAFWGAYHACWKEHPLVSGARYRRAGAAWVLFFAALVLALAAWIVGAS